MKNRKNLFVAGILLGFFLLHGFFRPGVPTAGAAGNYTVEYLQNDWGSGATVSVTLTNTGAAAINGWTLGWTFSGNQKITNLWNGSFTQSGAAVTVTNQSHNATIPANGGTVTFGFNLTYSGSNTAPVNFTLNGNTPATPSPEVTATTTPTPTVTPTSSSGGWENNRGTINLGTTISYTGTGISTNGSTVNINAGGDFTVSGTLANGMLYVNTTETVRLRLNGVNITNSTGPAIYFANAAQALITLNSGTTNYLVDGATYSDTDAKAPLFSNDPLELDGTGALTITGKYKHGIAGDDNVVIKNGNLTVTAVTDGIHANNSVTVDGGTITITANSDGIDSEGDLVINNGTLTLTAGDDGLHADATLTVKGGKVNVLKAVEGIEGKTALTVDDGQLTVVASEDGFNAGGSLTVNGGTINVTAGKDGFDSNGPLQINGGSIVAYGGNIPEGGFDCDSNTFTIKGGTLLGLGGNTSGPTANTSTQCSAVLSGASANAVVSIKKADGTEILNFTPTKTYTTMLFSSPSLVANTTYTMYINGTATRTFTTTTMVTSAGGIIFGPGGGGWW